jgi:hypothetical protein
MFSFTKLKQFKQAKSPQISTWLLYRCQELLEPTLLIKIPARNYKIPSPSTGASKTNRASPLAPNREKARRERERPTVQICRVRSLWVSGGGGGGRRRSETTLWPAQFAPRPPSTCRRRGVGARAQRARPLPPRTRTPPSCGSRVACLGFAGPAVRFGRRSRTDNVSLTLSLPVRRLRRSRRRSSRHLFKPRR